jgi:hypothetical protein
MTLLPAERLLEDLPRPPLVLVQPLLAVPDVEPLPPSAAAHDLPPEELRQPV